MRALAELIMRGRAHAAGAALLGNWIPLLAPATVTLVALRLGSRQGLWIMLWGILPAVLTMLFSSLNPLMPLVVVGSLSITCGAALILRATASWARTLMGVVALSTLAALLVALLAPAAIAVFVGGLAEVFELWQERMGVSADVRFVPTQAFVLGMVAYVIALGVVTGLLLGRWWQALLYNPGGFRQEFHALRLSVPQALVCLVAGVYVLLQTPDYGIWALVFTLPLLIAGLALVHGLARQRGWGVQWLVLLYVLLLLIEPVSQLLIALAFVDTWLNFRGRFRPKSE